MFPPSIFFHYPRPRVSSYSFITIPCSLSLSCISTSPLPQLVSQSPLCVCVCFHFLSLCCLFTSVPMHHQMLLYSQPVLHLHLSNTHTHTHTHTLFHKSDNFYFCFCFLLHLSTCFRPETRGPTCSKPNQSINMIIWPFSHSFSHRNISFFVLLHSSVYEQN